jgi:hypothetical protein
LPYSVFIYIVEDYFITELLETCSHGSAYLAAADDADIHSVIAPR